MQDSILNPERNCWRIAEARRASVLIDGENYYSAFLAAASKAERTLYISAWDIHSRVSLLRGNKHEIKSSRLGRVLRRLLKDKPDLHIHILLWDYAFVYALEREQIPGIRLGSSLHKRIHLCTDSEVPLGGSQHQKIVCVDDQVAFCGGFDISRWRWDTRRHLPRDKRRRSPSGEPYWPNHDIQLMVDGDMAKSLAELFRRRWLRATGETLAAPPPIGTDPWPQSIEPDFVSCEWALSRTEPAFKGREEVREVEQLYVDSIAAAEEFIYIENQYFTSSVVCQSLVDVLEQPDAPEVIILLPRQGPDWLEQSTMDVLRHQVFERLCEAAPENKLRVYYPQVPGLDTGTNVHAKLMIIDDQFLRIGSSNLSNRSLGYDTEADLSLEDGGNTDIAKAIGYLRRDLLAEHLGCEIAEVERAEQKNGSLIQAVESLRDGENTLAAHDMRKPKWSEDIRVNPELLDPSRPVALERMIEKMAPPSPQGPSRLDYFKWLAPLGLMVLLAIAWHWGPLADVLTLDSVVSLGEKLRGEPLAILAVVASFIIGELVMVPVVLLIGACGVLFTPWLGTLYAVAGCVASAMVSYGLGRLIGKGVFQNMTGGKLDQISQKLGEHGLVSVLLVRLVPVAPFALINLAAGYSHIRFWHLVVGTLIGVVPGVLAINVFADQLVGLVLEPQLQHVVILVLILLLLYLVGWAAKRFLFRAEDGEAEANAEDQANCKSANNGK